MDEQVNQAEIPGREGYLGILPGHAPLLSALKPGVLTYSGGAGEHVLVVDGGFVEVFENHVRVLAEHAELAQDVKVDLARQQLEKANEALKQAHEAAESARALEEAEKAQARIDAAARGSGQAAQ